MFETELFYPQFNVTHLEISLIFYFQLFIPSALNTMSKIQQAQEHIQLAEKYLKTTLLKWKPDYDSAADEYYKAGKKSLIFHNSAN